MIQVFKIIHGLERIPVDTLFEHSTSNTRGHSLKIVKQRCSTKIRQDAFSQRVINDWNTLPEEVVTATTANAFKARLDREVLLGLSFMYLSSELCFCRMRRTSCTMDGFCLLYLLMILLVRSGDVETNPGPDRIVSEKEFLKLSKQIEPSHYQEVGINLDISIAELGQIKERSQNTSDALMTVFTRWRDKQPPGTDIRALLAEELERSDLRSLSGELLAGSLVLKRTGEKKKEIMSAARNKGYFIAGHPSRRTAHETDTAGLLNPKKNSCQNTHETNMVGAYQRATASLPLTNAKPNAGFKRAPAKATPRGFDVSHSVRGRERSKFAPSPYRCRTLQQVPAGDQQQDRRVARRFGQVGLSLQRSGCLG
eukprot:XP_011683988.1 PREDICTED: uncharacterized protein LOC105447519 [Strongylocentrotus purpuratus]